MNSRTIAKVVFGSWSSWFVYQVFDMAANIHEVSKPGAWRYSSWVFGGTVTVGIGWWLAWKLYKEPKRSTANWFAVICAILIWKFYVGGILFLMHPAFGGHTLTGAIVEWWTRSSSSVTTTVETVARLLLLLFSVGYWSILCFGRSAPKEGKQTGPS
ncbi:MAG: hypothetical protein HZA92_01010 [Verrucomicrobia bacterium]|nr:hypothetical protein [Verrucomicrobiota bacterium]